jgi:hypothetical protein
MKEKERLRQQKIRDEKKEKERLRQQKIREWRSVLLVEEIGVP